MNQLWIWVLKIAYRPIVRRAAKRCLTGRMVDPAAPEKGRWLRSDLDPYLEDTWNRVNRILPSARFDELPNFGNRHNVFLAVVTMAAYQSLLLRNVEQHYAADLVADVGWDVYSKLLRVAYLPWRLTTLDPQKRMNRTLRALMIFPFSAPGYPGYEVKVIADSSRCLTHWTSCPPQNFVRRWVEENGDGGELDAFFRSWCLYDWPGADVLAGGSRGDHYERPHTMSKGDSVCDMCWRAKP